jgi:hypothetical protein
MVLSLARGFADLRDSSAALQFEITLDTHTPAGSYDDHALPLVTICQPGLLQLWR